MSDYWGGHWTDKKLKVFSEFLELYQLALKKQRFKKIYIDALAGDGISHVRQDQAPSLLDEDEALASDKLRVGSAQIALDVEPAFDQYWLNEKDASKAASLHSKASQNQFPQDRVLISSLDANEFLAEILNRINPSEHRGVILLDPWGLQVNWSTIEKIAETQCLDMWYLFPTSAIVRMCPRKGMPPQKWADRLDQVLGSANWREEFYKSELVSDLLSFDRPEFDRNVSFESVQKFVVKRLTDTFKGEVWQQPVPLGPRNKPIFSFCFAMGNPSPAARGLAKRLVAGIIKANRD